MKNYKCSLGGRWKQYLREKKQEEDEQLIHHSCNLAFLDFSKGLKTRLKAQDFEPVRYQV